MKGRFFYPLCLLATLLALIPTSCNKQETEPELPQPDNFDGILLDRLIDAGYRTDNSAGAGNYELQIGNTTSLQFKGDVNVFIDFFNEADADPLNPVLPSGKYVPGDDYGAFTYDPSTSYVEIFTDGEETVVSPVIGEVTVERTGAEYTITVSGELMLLDNMAFSARYKGRIAFTQRGTAAYSRFDEPQNITFEHVQGRYWGNWFCPHADDLAMEFFSGEFSEDGVQQKGYYLNLGIMYMPKYKDYNAEYIPVAQGEYVIWERDPLSTSSAVPYTLTYGRSTSLYGEEYLQGCYVTYIDRENNIKRLGLAKSGKMIVEASGDVYKITFDFITEEGISIKGKYEGKVSLGNYNDNDLAMPERPWSTMTEDHVYAFPDEAACYAYYMGDYIMPGVGVWMLMIYGYNDTYPDGYGDMFTTELLLEMDENPVFPVGTFNAGWELKPGNMLPGFTDFGGSVLYTYYGDLTPSSDGYSSESAPIERGTVSISKADNGDYMFTFDLTDDAGNKITGLWQGTVYPYDISDELYEE